MQDTCDHCGFYDIPNGICEYIEFHTVSFARGYKDKNNEWASTTNLREQDIPKMRMLLQKAFEFMVMKEVT